MDMKIKKENDSNRKLVVPTFKSSEEINKEFEDKLPSPEPKVVTVLNKHEDDLELTTQMVTTEIDTDSFDTIDIENDLKVIDEHHVDNKKVDEDTIRFADSDEVEEGEEDVVIETPPKQFNINLRYVYLCIFIVIIFIAGFIGYKVYSNSVRGEKYVAAALEQPLKISDINVYGESVNLISDKHFEQVDLYNVDTEESTTQKLGTSIDEQLHFSSTPDGTYYLFANNQIITSDNQLNVSYQTITRDSINKDVSLKTNDQHIVEVKVTTASKPQVDILIDASQGDVQGFTASDNKTTEQQLSLKYAQSLKKQLEKLGYNVELTRNDDSVPGDCNYNEPYCETGRVAMAYTKNPKLYIAIGFNGTGGSGFEITDSKLNSHTLGRLIKTSISASIAPSERVSGQLDAGLFNNTYEDESGNVVDYLYLIRETGGQIMNSDNKEAKAFNTKKVGAETIRIDPGYMSEASDFKKLDGDSEIETFTKALASAVDQYINRN